MTEDTSLSWEDYLKRKDSTGSPGDDQIIIPIMWFKQTARMQWSFYKNMLLSGNVHFFEKSILQTLHCNTKIRKRCTAIRVEYHES